ncbi:MAG: hypothetical protein IJP31_11410 [Lachnospiraceae bacterium]|nr:hypothetical protein [Lachnospiraceae bacterium]
MNPKEKQIHFRTLILITSPKLADKAIKLFHTGSIPVQYQLRGVGTASSDMMDILGLGSPDKTLLVTILPKIFADKLLKKVKKELKLGTTNSGIAFTMPLSGVNNLLFRMLEKFTQDEDKPEMKKKEEEIVMGEIKHSLIAAVVNQGYSEAVMDAARQAGAGGGTVVHSRRLGDTEAMGFWGLSIQEEKELVFIVAGKEQKLKIMQAIGEKCGVHSEAKGIVVSLPIDTVIGIENDDEG